MGQPNEDQRIAKETAFEAIGGKVIGKAASYAKPVVKRLGKVIKTGLGKVAGYVERKLGGIASKSVTLDPSKIRFTQDSIKSTFRDGRSIKDLVSGLKSGKISPNDVPAIRVFQRNGRTYSLDNRRLKAFQDAGIPVRTRQATTSEISAESFKFTTRNDGISIRVKGE